MVACRSSIVTGFSIVVQGDSSAVFARSIAGVPAEVTVDVVDVGNVGMSEQRIRPVGLEHVDEHEMLAGEQTHVADETLGEHRILQ